MSVCVGLCPGLGQFLRKRIFHPSAPVDLRLGGGQDEAKEKGSLTVQTFREPQPPSVAEVSSTVSHIEFF